MKNRAVIASLLFATLGFAYAFFAYRQSVAYRFGHKSLSSQQAPDGEAAATRYANRTPECLHPTIAHLCSDFSQQEERLGSNQYFSITCDDSCGNIYSFSKILFFSHGKKDEPWESSADQYLGGIADHFTVLQRGAQSPQALSDEAKLAKEQADIRAKELDLAHQAATIWSNTLAQFPVANPGVVHISHGIVMEASSAMMEGAKTEVTPYLGTLIKAGNKLQEKIDLLENSDFPQTVALEEELHLVNESILLLNNNESALMSGDQASIIYLSDIAKVNGDLQASSSKGIVPRQVTDFVAAMASNSAIQKIMSDQNDLEDQEHDHFQKEEEFEKNQDPAGGERNKKERCISPTAKDSEVYPSHSGLNLKILEVAKALQEQMPVLEINARNTHRDYVAALQDTQNANAPYYLQHADQVHAVALVREANPALAQKNVWSEKVFARLDEEHDPQKRLDDLQYLSSCDTLSYRIEAYGAKVAAPLNVKSLSAQSPNDSLMVLKTSRKVGTSRLLMEIQVLPDGKAFARIYVLDGPHAPVTAVQACAAFSGFCTDPQDNVHEGLTPYVDFDMPKAKTFPAQLKAYIKHVSQEEFLSLMKSAELNP